MTVTLRNYNGIYSVFLELNGEKELIKSTRIFSDADKTFKELENKIKKDGK